MTILDDLLAAIEEDAPIRSIWVGAHWTVVCSRHCGLASTLLSEQPHGHERVRDVGRLHLKSARELAGYSLSSHPLEASIGVATINSLLEVDERQAVEINAEEVLVGRGQGKKVAMVGHFPFIPRLHRVAQQLWVIEQRPTQDEYPAEAAPDLIPQADVVALTGSALINHTLDGLLSLCSRNALIMILGPSTPLSPVLFRYGASMLSGSRVTDEAAALRTIGQGATFNQAEGVQKLTISNVIK
jgi:uncharacterized protein (DUF4213/DUF364 family)